MNFYDLKDEMPSRKGQQIELPKFMLSETGDDVNDPEKITVKDIIRLASLAGICWFFCFMDNNVMVGLVGLIASTAVLCMTGGDRSDLY